MIYLIYRNRQHRLFKAIIPDKKWNEVIAITDNQTIVDCFKSNNLTEYDFNGMFLSLIYRNRNEMVTSPDTVVFS